jgi:uncharacterized protein YndB with AHSA1/START domain
MKKALLSLSLIVIAAFSALAQEVTDKSYVTKTGEKVLRFEMTMPVDAKRVWRAFSDPEDMKGWIAPVIQLDLRIGGTLLTNYEKTAKITDASTIRLSIINYLEGELMTYKVELKNNVFPKKVQDEDQNLQEIIQIFDLGGGKTRLVSSMIGWGAGKEWDDAYAFFAKGNKWTYEELIKHLLKKPDEKTK